MSSKFNLKIRDHLGDPEKIKHYNEMHFAEAAPRYDLATRAMSLCRDTSWKRHMVGSLPPVEKPFCVDLACGTGDVAFLLAGRYPGGTVVGLDLTEPMLEIARKRDIQGKVTFVRGDMNETGFPDESVDIITGSYALRNAPDIHLAIREAHRILKPGGAAAFLDFSRPLTRPVQHARHWLLKIWLGFWGLALHGNHEIHGYVASSLDGFPDRIRLRRLFIEEGFTVTGSRRFFFGILELLVVRKVTKKGN